MKQMTSICDMVGQIMQKKEEERRIAEDQAAKDRYWKIPICYDDDEDYTITITPVLSTKEVVDSLIMEDEHLDTIPATKSDEVIKSSVENLVQILTFKEHSETIIDFNDNSTSSDDDSPYGEDINYVDTSPPDAEIVSLEVVEIVIPEVGGVDIDIPLMPNVDLLTLCLVEIVRSHLLRLIFFPKSSSDEILHEKLLNVNLLVDKIEALKLTPSIPFMLENPSFSPIPVVDNDFLIEEVDTFLVSEDSIPPGIKSDLDSEGDNVFLNNLLNEYPIPEYEHFTFDIEPDVPVINNFDELNEDECFDPGGGEIVVSQNVKDDDSFAFVIRIFLPYRTYLVDSPLLLSTGSEDTIFDPGIST
ncbi:hypothetical protein Tco_0502906 [Tanacetum coccineum]